MQLMVESSPNLYEGRSAAIAVIRGKETTARGLA
jgi:hypothetical protein